MVRITDLGRDFIDQEIDALTAVRDRLGGSFEAAVDLIMAAPGKVVVTGMGKSGIVARKIAATMVSTGTLAVYLHPGEGLHGDLGLVATDDVVLAFSKSGETEELLLTLPAIKRIGARLIAVVNRGDSTLADQADVVLELAFDREACPLNLAPTSSALASMALGDAIALVLMKLRDFQPEDFALYHPGGALGKRLLLRVADLMHSGADNPLVSPEAGFRDVIDALTSRALGAASVVDPEGKLIGIITDGDIRRSFDLGESLFQKSAGELMTRDPVVVRPDSMAYDALRLMEERSSQISVLPVVDENGLCVGLLRVHDLLQIGIRR